MLIKDAINGYIKYQTSEGIDIERTLNKYIMCINEFVEFMQIKDTETIDNLTWIDIKINYINVKKDNLGSQSINLRITALRSFFSYLEGSRLIRENVVDNIKKEKTKKKEVDIDIEKVRALLTLLDEEFKMNPTYMTARNKFVIHLLIFSGMRNEETRMMTISDINIFNGEFATHNSKFDKSRDLVLPDKLITMYREYLSYRNLVDTDSDLLFVSRTGKALNKNALTDLVKNRSKKVGLENFAAHSCRHAYATISLASGNSIESVSKTLGHVNVTITSGIYAEKTKEVMKEVANNNILLNQII